MTSTPRALRSSRLLLAGCLTAAVIAGCGSSNASTTTTPSDQLAPNATPQQILKASAAALASAGSYRMRATMTELTTPRTHARVSFSIYSKHQFSMSMTTAGASFELILDNKRAYMRANRRFWLSHGEVAAAAVFANRWLQSPPASVRKLTASFGNLASTQAASCLLEHGRLSLAGTTVVGQQDAVVVRDAGNEPGGQPQTLAVAMLGTPYPLRLTATGTQRPGGPTKGPCAGSSGPSSVGSMTLSDFGQLGPLTVPAHAINLQALEQHKTHGITPVI